MISWQSSGAVWPNTISLRLVEIQYIGHMGLIRSIVYCVIRSTVYCVFTVSSSRSSSISAEYLFDTAAISATLKFVATVSTTPYNRTPVVAGTQSVPLKFTSVME